MVLQQSADLQLNKSNKIPPPGPPTLPFVSVLPFFRKHLPVELHKLAKKYGNIFQLRVGSRTLVVLNGLETIREALVKQQDSFNAKSDFFLYQIPPTSFFLESKSGELWKKHHDIVIKFMRMFFAGKSDTLETWLLEEAADLANIFLNFGSQSFDPNLYLPLATLSFMQRLVFDKRGSFEDSDFVTTARSLTELRKAPINGLKLLMLPAIWRPIFILLILSRWRQFRNSINGLNRLEDYVTKNVEQHQESFDPENLRDMTDGLLKASGEQTESDRKNFRLGVDDIVKGTLYQFIGGGGELPKLILHWALLYMIIYPEIQAEIQKELDEVVGREQQPNLNHRGKLPFTEACINEILRHASPANLPVLCYATASDTTLNGYFIPQKTSVLVNYYSLTRDELYWQEPEQFNPYRFLDENGKLRKDLLDKFYPFGTGARRCVGEYLGRLQIFLFFTNLMHRCKFEQVPEEKLSLEPQPILFAGPQDYRVIVKPRF